MRVMFIVPRLRVGGAERHVATLLTHLDGTRYEASLLSLGEGGRNFDDVAAAGIPARALRRTRRGLALALVQTTRHVRHVRPDVVVVQGANAEAIGRIAAVLTGVPRTVVWVHNCGDVAPRRRIRRIADQILEPATSAYYGVAHAQWTYLTRDLKFPPDKVRIIHNGVDPAPFDTDDSRGRDGVLADEFEIPVGAPVVGIVAVLRPEKDHATFLFAARLVLQEEPRTVFLIVGHGDRRADLERLAAELGMADSVRFTGERSDIPALLKLMDIFVLSSRTVECFPMALLEAMAAGKPAVCTAVGGVPEIILDGTTGHLVPVGDPAAMADRLVALVRDPDRARAMGTAGRSRLKAEFTLRHSVDRAEAAFAETLGWSWRD